MREVREHQFSNIVNFVQFNPSLL